MTTKECSPGLGRGVEPLLLKKKINSAQFHPFSGIKSRPNTIICCSKSIIQRMVLFFVGFCPSARLARRGPGAVCHLHFAIWAKMSLRRFWAKHIPRICNACSEGRSHNRVKGPSVVLLLVQCPGFGAKLHLNTALLQPTHYPAPTQN